MTDMFTVLDTTTRNLDYYGARSYRVAYEHAQTLRFACIMARRHHGNAVFLTLDLERHFRDPRSFPYPMPVAALIDDKWAYASPCGYHVTADTCRRCPYRPHCDGVATG